MCFSIIGLGNPGSKYENTRHNAGFWVLDHIASRLNLSWNEKGDVLLAQARLGGHKIVLIKPQSFMNLSGEAAIPIIKFFKIPVGQVIVVHDELDLDPGRIQVRHGGSSGGHRGLEDLFRHLGGRNFLRVRVGIGHPKKHSTRKYPEKVEDWVLAKPGREDQILLEDAVTKSSEAAMMLIEDSLEAVQRSFNVRI